MRSGPVHVVTTRRAYKGKVYQTHLLRRTYREDGKVKNETVSNISCLPESVVELIRASLRGQAFAPVDEQFDVVASPHHGHVQAVMMAIQRLGLDKLVHSRRSRERDLVLGMIAARVLAPQSKLSTTRWWHTTTLPGELGITEADEDELYAAMDWLLKRQKAIEKKLAHRHLTSGGLVLYDLSSSYFEGTHCPLAAIGHSRDGKKGTLQVNYGLVTNRDGCPVSVSVFAGNTGDSTTLVNEVQQVQERFGIERLVIVGDRGMIGEKQIEELRSHKGVGWITALKTGAIRKLLDQGHIQMGLFDERNLFELRHPQHPDERLVACRNPELAELRAKKRQDLIDATCRELDKVRGMVERGRLRGADKIGVRAGKVVNKYKVAKHFELQIEDERFSYQLQHDRIAAEAALDGVYVIRTSVPARGLKAPDVARSYKLLSNVERAFRSFKTVDLNVRPIRHWAEDRVRSHILLCMLAYYVQWHMQEAWRPLLFADEDQQAKATRDPVAPARRSAKAEQKAVSKSLEDGSLAHSFRSLLATLSTIVRNVCHRKGANEHEPTFQVQTTPTAKQRRALDLINGIQV